MMSGRRLKHLQALDRRRTHLAERLELWARGDRDRTAAEKAALDWALKVIVLADMKGQLQPLLDELAADPLTYAEVHAAIYPRKEDDPA